MMQETTCIVKCTAITITRIASIFMAFGAVARSLIGTPVIGLISIVIAQMLPV